MFKQALAVALCLFPAAASLADEPRREPMTTTWGDKVTADNVWQEYPRPQLERSDWTNLNGKWSYAVTPSESVTTPEEWDGEILVPFCLESHLGGVKRELQSDEALWYRRTFDAKKTGGKRTLLNFEAVDYACQVWVNGKSVGTHRGGNTPFWFDVTDALKYGENELTVRVIDATEDWQLRGKQVRRPNGIWYTRVSGIWQTVWLEEVDEAWIADLDMTTDADEGTIKIKADVEGDDDYKFTARVLEDGKEVVANTASGDEVTLTVPDAKLWSPKSPHLYELELTLTTPDGDVIDKVKSYAGIRSVGTTKDKDGHLVLTLNGEPIFHWGPLDQGWWPDGLLTPPSDEAMLSDVEYLRDAGFNMIRKHIKVEPRRYYYHCDRLGMMLWQDQVSGGPSPKWTRLAPDPEDANWPDARHDQWMLELERMIDELDSHPSIVVWVPFNEAWGQHRTVEVGEWLVKRDPSRIVNVASGGNFWPAGHIVDHHAYPHPDFPFNRGKEGRFDGFVKVVGEFGGHGFPVEGHLWRPGSHNWGYGGLPKDEAEYLDRYRESLRKLGELRSKGIAAGVYTQTTDVEGEINGLLTYDRRVTKIPAKELAEIAEGSLFSKEKE
ncbi:glycoside hydrolase family 2 protein [Botrimarina mediterranea]|uniref:Beta-galactosidase n=1 Tax=Botrimarina mediterranea TaxID=2528022 RepID=A0A518K4L7_9BACT|nr:sugar-binding domain-containing protein [Botrimarina mediterranea]QDV72738.1 Beta-galactosidase [Botrimarina mediterranea]QDV77312.1 Beta-galactosidase [Planctomycetes bacterium K2D]